MARERVGLDPLAETYLALGADKFQMTYVAGHAESMSFPDGHFDVVSSFNSLEFFDKLERHLIAVLLDPLLAEIARVLKPGGLLLLLTDWRYAPSRGVPGSFASDLTQAIGRRFEILSESHYEQCGFWFYDSIEQDIAFDPDDPTPRSGILSLKARKPEVA